jgi:DNA-binding transcriptional MocR family regulator
MPNVGALPLDVVAATVSKLIAERGEQALQYGSGQGDIGLREQITAEILPTVGISAHPDDLVVTTGSQQALDLVTRVFCDPGDVVLAEAPSYVGALSTFAAYEVDVVQVPMDQEGLDPAGLGEALRAARGAGRTVKFIYTVPSFHNPAGVTQGPQRRAAVLEVAHRAGVLVVEDDPYGLLGFDGVVPQALRASDGEGVVYLGSFSKIFAAGLRVGYAVAPHGIREKLVLASEASVLCPSAYGQLTVSTYLASQPWMEQVKVFRELYRERRDSLLDALTTQMPAGTTWTAPSGGFYSWVTLPDGLDAGAMLPRAVTARVAYVPGTAFYAGAAKEEPAARSSMRLSYCFPPAERIREGVRRLAAVVEEELELTRTFGPTSGHPRASLGDSPSPDLA